MRKRFAGREYDTSNISGRTLAEIGKLILNSDIKDDSEITKRRVIARSDVIDYESLKWLDDVVNEVCTKGRI